MAELRQYPAPPPEPRESPPDPLESLPMAELRQYPAPPPEP